VGLSNGAYRTYLERFRPQTVGIAVFFRRTGAAGRGVVVTSRKNTHQSVARNRRATFDYEIEDRYEAGIVLTGTEVKSLRAGQANIAEGAYVQVEDNQAWLMSAHIPEYTQGNRNNHEPRRRRRLLLSRHEIERLHDMLRLQGYSGVPIELYFKDGWAKLEFGVGRGKRHYDKRHSEREKIDRRERADER